MPIAEKALIAEIRRVAKSSKSAVRAGIGDDCAILRRRSGRETLVTTDFSLEGVHFRRDWHSADSVGHRCLARGLSDIAAMGGDPEAAFLSLALPWGLPQSWVRGFFRGLMRLAEKLQVTLAGGDTAESPDGILADIVVVGSVPKRKAVLRSEARTGDRIFVSGQLGGSAAAVLQLTGKPKVNLRPRDYPRHFYPEPRLALGRILREKGFASAMIDTSDGLSTDLYHLCEESGVGAAVDATLIPCAAVGKPMREVALDLALHGGEDYELLFTSPWGKCIPAQLGGVAVTQIGQITPSRKIIIRTSANRAHELEPRGWEHFRR
jgi:thiamine-monophosphate kinase